MLSVIFESMWVWYLAGVALWAFIGALVASAQGLPVGVGAAAGAIFWLFGVMVVIVVGLARPRGRAGDAAPARFPAASHPSTTYPATAFPAPTFPAAAAPVPHNPFASASSAPYTSGSSDPFGAPAVSPSPWGGSDGWGWPDEPAVRAPAYSSAPTPRVAPEVVRRRVLVGAGVAGGIAMIVSVFLPWGSGRIAWSAQHRHVNGDVAPISAGPVALAIFFTAAVVIVGAFVMSRRPGVAWPMLAAVVTTWWFCLVLEWLLVESSLTSVTDSADRLSGDSASASLSTASGVWIMLVGCVLVYGWCGTASMPLLRRAAAAASGSASPAFGF